MRVYPYFCLMLIGYLLIGCGGSDTSNSSGDCEGMGGIANPQCFLLPSEQEPKTTAGKADFSCLNQASSAVPPNKDLIIRGKTQQRLSNGTDEDKGNVSVEVWTDQTTLDEASRVAKTTSSNSGEYEVVIPASAWANASATGVRVAWRISSDDTIPTIEFNDTLPINEAQPDGSDPSKLVLEDLNRITLTRSTLQVINSLLGITNEYDRQKGLVLGVVRDCKRQEVEFASAGIVDVQGTSVSGPLLFYFQNKFPVLRSEQGFTSTDGYFTLVNVEPNKTADVRVIGLVDGKKTWLSRQMLPIKSDTFVIADFDPLEEPIQ